MSFSPKTFYGKQIQEELGRIERGEKSPSRRQELNVWFEQWRKRLGPDALQEVAVLLGKKRRLDETPFRELVPEGWLKELLELVADHESPSPFFFLSGLTVLSQNVGRRVMVDHGSYDLGLDMSALLIAPAGKARRSTGSDFVVYGIGCPAGISTIADSFSFEAFGDALVESAGCLQIPQDRIIKNPRALIYAGEMSTLLGKGSYGESIIPKLTDIIGKTSRFEWRTVKRGGKLVFEKPMVNALFTSAPDWLADNLPPVVFGGGLLSRFLICVQEEMERVVTWGATPDREKRLDLINGLRRIQTVRGSFPKPEGAAYKWYDDWYQKAMANLKRGDIPDTRMEPYFSRKHDHLVRLAALLTLAAREPLKLTVEKFEQALRILEWLERDVPKAYAHMALSPIAAAQRAAVRMLERNRNLLEHSRLQRMMYRHTPLAEQFGAVMNSLVQMGIVQVLPSVSGKGKCYRLRRNLE